ncbi:MAG: hypothetical protein R3F31_19620 [Verrucomicrobiales bacterium]
MLVECSQHYRKAPKIGVARSQRQVGQSKEVKALSWRMQHRLHRRYVKLKARGGRTRPSSPLPGRWPPPLGTPEQTQPAHPRKRARPMTPPHP